MDVRLGTTDSGSLDASYSAGDLVPESGIYGLECHGARTLETAAFVRGQFFPECDQCGRRGRYRLVQGAPYILEDPDFAD